MLGKAGFFPQAFHVPLLLRHPAGVRGRRVTEFTEHIDVMPTILESLDLEIPRQCDGRSLSTFLTADPPCSWRSATHWEHDFRDVVTCTYEQALGLDSDACSLAVRFDGRCGYVHFAALPPLCFIEDSAWLCDRARDPTCAGEVLAQAQGMLSWRLMTAERRLTGCALTPEGVFGPYDPL
jgi:arylsulfatase A-like enzyme